jgi:hypothetical protein
MTEPEPGKHVEIRDAKTGKTLTEGKLVSTVGGKATIESRTLFGDRRFDSFPSEHVRVVEKKGD